jgi:hypothetical protein
MKSKGLILLAVVLVLGMWTVVWAQERCEAPTLSIGDEWTYGGKNNAHWKQEVIGIENDIYVIRYGNEVRGLDKNTMNHVCPLDKDSKRTTFDGTRSRILDFPLHVGKKWTHTSTLTGVTAKQNYSEEYSVSSQEEVTVAGGVFKAFKIEYRHFDTRTLKEKARGTYWYSPEVKGIVKRLEFVSKLIGDMELLSYKLSR